jgi:integrase
VAGVRCARVSARPLYKMMLCTAQRRGEVASMKWSQIGADGWRLPAASAKTKVGHLVPLSSLAREILGSLPQIGEYVFRAHRDAPLQGWSKAKAKLDGLVTLGEPWQVEDTRRSAATHMRSLGVDPRRPTAPALRGQGTFPQTHTDCEWLRREGLARSHH